jgi:hypothetical protein
LKAPKRQLKEKLSLTIRPASRTKARKLARRGHRSISSLFEHLIEVEYQRIQGKAGEIYRLSGIAGSMILGSSLS